MARFNGQYYYLDEREGANDDNWAAYDKAVAKWQAADKQIREAAVGFLQTAIAKALPEAIFEVNRRGDQRADLWGSDTYAGQVHSFTTKLGPHYVYCDFVTQESEATGLKSVIRFGSYGDRKRFMDRKAKGFDLAGIAVYIVDLLCRKVKMAEWERDRSAHLKRMAAIIEEQFDPVRPGHYVDKRYVGPVKIEPQSASEALFHVSFDTLTVDEVKALLITLENLRDKEKEQING